MIIRGLSIFILVIVVFNLLACQSQEQLKPIKEETIEFDMNTAIEMVEKREEMIIELASREKLSIMEYKEIEAAFTEEFGNHTREILPIFFINNEDTDSGSDMYVQHNTLYPTVFHEGIIITNASIYKSYYENEFFNQTRLSIKEQYTGDDENLKDWTREYFFIPNETGEWELNGFSGIMNFLGEEYNVNNPRLKSQACKSLH